MNMPNLVTIRVWGDFACFTRPEMKVERVSYPVITPSAARGVLEAVFWEPQMYYLIDSIRIHKRGRWISFRRNEVNDVISIPLAKQWMNNPEKVNFIHADDPGRKEALVGDDGRVIDPKREATRAQRNMLALQDVEYSITAEVRTTPLANRPEDKLSKYLSEIERRARSGKCFHRPCLGVREFAADFDWEPIEDKKEQRPSVPTHDIGTSINEDFGLMLYDVFDPNDRAKGFRWLNSNELKEQENDFESSIQTLIKGQQTKQREAFAKNRLRSTCPPARPQPLFFNASMRNSRMDCHPERIQVQGLQNGGRSLCS